MNKTLQVIITVAVFTNLALTAVILKRTANPQAVAQNSSPSNPLPHEIDKSVISLIAESFTEKYNSGNLEEFETVFSEFARAQMKKEDIKKNFDSLQQVFGDISKTTYSHYEFSGQQGNVKYFTLHYIAELQEESRFGKLGKLKITISWDRAEYGIVSAYLHAGTQ
jgi:hypothetical protein